MERKKKNLCTTSDDIIISIENITEQGKSKSAPARPHKTSRAELSGKNRRIARGRYNRTFVLSISTSHKTRKILALDNYLLTRNGPFLGR